VLSRAGLCKQPYERDVLIAVVYTMGKVGSSAVADALLRAGLPCHHIHTLNRSALLARLKRSFKAGQLPPRHVYVSLLLRRRLTNRRRCIYISMVRNPIERNLSAYFEEFAHFRRQIKGDADDPETVFSHFLHKYAHSASLNWFDRELRDQVGIDVYQQQFDYDARYAWLARDKTLILRADCPDERKSAILSEIFDTEITVRRSNEGEQKARGPLYAKVKELAAYDHKFLNRMLDHRFTRHFWSGAELQHARRQLSGDGNFDAAVV
jgi:hypothetical protein